VNVSDRAVAIARTAAQDSGVAVGGRFAPEALDVRGRRAIDIGAAQGQPR
jgi:hypothetical protein